MSLRRMFDAAWPPTSPPDWEAVAGYIGGNTPHVWTAAEWARQKARYRLPIFVRSHDGDPVADAKFSVGWLKGHGAPTGSTLALDYETRVDGVYLKAFDMIVVAAGYKTMVYGSRSFVEQNPKPSGGYWTATWNNVPHLDPGAAATQYGGDTQGEPYDANLVANSTPLWDTLGEDMAFTDADKQWLLDNIKQEVTNTYRLADHGTTDKETGGANRKQIKAAVDAVNAKFDEVSAKVDALAVELDALAAQGVVIDPSAIARATVDDLVNRVSFKAA